MTFDVVTIMKFNKHLTAISKHLNRTKAIPYNNKFEPPPKKKNCTQVYKKIENKIKVYNAQ